MKPFASFGDQKVRSGIKGYEADTYGLAVGADTRLNANSIAGLGFSYADTDVDGKGAGRSHSDIKSYQLTAYADYTEKDWYVEGLVGYAHNDMDTSRDITVTSTKAKGDTKSGQYMVSVNAGMPQKLDEEGTYFTPTLGLSITHVDNEAYTETGAGVLNLKVDPEDITIAKASFGGRLHTKVEDDDGIFVPELRAQLHYDVAGDEGSSSNTFTGGGPAFQVEGMDVEELSVSGGVGIAYAPTGGEMEGMSFSVNYDAEFKDDFTGQSGNFNFRYAF
jgi:outer membrane autotransporter protein